MGGNVRAGQLCEQGGCIIFRSHGKWILDVLGEPGTWWAAGWGSRHLPNLSVRGQEIEMLWRLRGQLWGRVQEPPWAPSVNHLVAHVHLQAFVLWHCPKSQGLWEWLNNETGKSWEQGFFFFFFSSTTLLLPTHLPPPSCTHAVM